MITQFKRFPVALILFSMLCTAPGCKSPDSDYTFSFVLESGFDPIAGFRKCGFALETAAVGERLRNSKAGYGWQSWCGILTDAEKPLTCEAVAVAIRDELNRALSGDCLDELTVNTRLPAYSELNPLTGMLLYNKDKMHGKVYVWLTPDKSTGSVGYTIFIREEPLK